MFVDTAVTSMSRPAVRIINDSMSESVDLLQMLIAPPPPPPPPSTSRPAAPAPHRVEDGTTAAAQRPRVTDQMCYRACHACAEERRYRQLQTQQQAECAYCSCSQPRVDPRPPCADRDDTAAIYFNPRGPQPPGAGGGPGCTWPRGPAPPVKARGPGLSAPRADVAGNSSESGCDRRGNDVVDDNDDYDDAAGKRTMSTSLSSRSSSRTAAHRTAAAEICRRARCCLRCWPRRCANANSAGAIAGDPLHQSSTADFDLCIQAAHGGHSEPASAAATVGKLGRKLSLRRGLRCATRLNIDAARRRTIMLVVGFLVGIFLVSTALLTGFVLLWPSQRRRHSTPGRIITIFNSPTMKRNTIILITN